MILVSFPENKGFPEFIGWDTLEEAIMANQELEYVAVGFTGKNAGSVVTCPRELKFVKTLLSPSQQTNC